MAEKDKSWKEKLSQAGKDLKSTFSNPETRQEISEKADKEKAAKYAAWDDEARKILEKSPNINALQLALAKKAQYAKDDEERKYWQNVFAKKTAPSKDGKVDGKYNNIQQAQIENGRQALLANAAGDTKTVDKLVNETTKTYNNVTKGAAVPKGDGKDFQIGDKQPEEEKKTNTNAEPKVENAETNTNPDTKKETPKDSGSKENKNKKYKSSMYGIIDAMKNGDIDTSTGIYFMLDALSKAARNTGIDIGNIGAQFSGGTVRNDYQDSLWNQRRNKMFENEMTSEINKQEGTDKEMEYNLAKEDLIGKGLSNEQADLALNASRTFNDKAEEFRKVGNDTMADLYALVGSAATREVGAEEIAAIAASNVLNTPEGKAAADEIINALTGLVGTVGNTFGGINSILSFLTGK